MCRLRGCLGGCCETVFWAVPPAAPPTGLFAASTVGNVCTGQRVYVQANITRKWCQGWHTSSHLSPHKFNCRAKVRFVRFLACPCPLLSGSSQNIEIMHQMHPQEICLLPVNCRPFRLAPASSSLSLNLSFNSSAFPTLHFSIVHGAGVPKKSHQMEFLAVFL